MSSEEDPQQQPPPAAYDRWTLEDDSQLDYGYFCQTPKDKLDPSGGGYYITTAINYTNGPPHMGHAYEAVTADALARFARLRGTSAAYFVTGADEHGQKIANTAAAQGKEPVDICNQVRGNCRGKGPSVGCRI
jgi:leucyl-tRNA synthetase